MPPNDYQDHSSSAANLPAMSPTRPQPAPPVNVSVGQGKQPVGLNDVTSRVVVQTKQLIQQYGNDPYKLSEALGQLKAAYWAEQYHIMPNQAEN
jgi:hypothetical protein